MKYVNLKCLGSHWKNIGESLENLRNDTRNSDLHFLVYNSKGLESRILAHQFIFIPKSNLLRKLCYEVKGKHGISEPVVITLIGFKSIAVEALISYFYYGHTNLKLMDSFCDLCRTLGISNINKISLEYIPVHDNTDLVDPWGNTKTPRHHSNTKIFTNYNLSEYDSIVLLNDKKIFCPPKVSLLKELVKRDSSLKEDPFLSTENPGSNCPTLFKPHSLLQSHTNNYAKDKSDNDPKCLSKKMKLSFTQNIKGKLFLEPSIIKDKKTITISTNCAPRNSPKVNSYKKDTFFKK
ncbi:uncharacterized protein [Lepeophtheirus salmonis]|uniref:BTB domain-containing protein n=1 Tax=Lepeophtheirus salmonis TaxID=72036 RepID=A0A0K2TGS4_LEPSM|nr:uncharacterized protein LOC121122184 [Lepeophtheirus salmonis]